jgi:hypothetical protein
MSPQPLHPLLSNVKGGWNGVEFLMKWFSKLVNRAYGWTDGIIQYRQNRVNNKYKIQKAENEAYRIMAEQRAQREGNNATTLTKRSASRWMDLGVDEELLDMDTEELQEILEMLE